MPIVDFELKVGWRLPDDPKYDWTAEMNPRLLAVHQMLVLLPGFVAAACREVDDIDLGPEDVIVKPGNLHALAPNALDAHVMINPDEGGPRFRFDPEQRRVRIHDRVWDRLFGARDDRYEYPEFDIDVIPAPMTGSSTNRQGVMLKHWGGVELPRHQVARR